MVWDTEQADRGWRGESPAGITSHPLLPGQARVSPLGTREDDLPFFGMHLGSRRKLHGHPLVSQELEAGPPMLPAVPVTPEQRMGADLEGVQQHAHLALLLRLVTAALTLLTHASGAAVCDPGRIDDAQAPLSFFAPFAREEQLACRAAHGPFWLEGEVLAREVPGLPGPPHHRRSVALRLLALFDCVSKLRRPQRSRSELMTEFESEVPEPLGDDLPRFLSSRGVTTPAVGVKFLVFIGKGWLKGAPMQVQGDDIGSREGTLRQSSEEQFVDDSVTCEANAALHLACRMGCHHNTATYLLWSHSHLWAVVEGSYQGACLRERTAHQQAGASGSGSRADPTRCSPCLA